MHEYLMYFAMEIEASSKSRSTRVYGKSVIIHEIPTQIKFL